MKRYPRSGVMVLACAIGLVLVGCSAGESDELGDGTAQNTAGTSSGSTASPENVEEQEATVAPEDCLTGAWLADNAFFLAGLQEFGTEPQSVTGEVIITYGADGTMTTDYQDWLITFLVDGGTTTISRIGIDSGTFTATSDTVRIKDTQMGSQLLVSMGGMSMPVDPTLINYADVPYTCTATSASLTTSDGEMRMTRR